MCNICATYEDRGFGPVVATWSSQANVLWAKSSNFQHIPIKHGILTSQYAKYPERVSMEMWGVAGQVAAGLAGGGVQDTTNT